MTVDPKFAASRDVPDFDYTAYAEALGLGGIRVARQEEVGNAWNQALSANRPCVVDALTDPDVPPLPPHITFKDAKHFASTLPRRS